MTATDRHIHHLHSTAWLEALRMRLPDDVYRNVLLHAPNVLLPHMTNPLLLSDFLTWAIRKGVPGRVLTMMLTLLLTMMSTKYPCVPACTQSCACLLQFGHILCAY